MAGTVNRGLSRFPLPDPSRATGSLRCRKHLRFGKPSCKRKLNDLPAQREISVAFRKGPDAMHMIRQDDPGIDVKRVAFPGGSYRLAEKVNVTD